MTSHELHAARQQLGWSVYEMADALRLGGSSEKGGQRVREMESGAKEISGPVAVAVEAFLTGFRPAHIDRGRG
jgi:hypothetical protein